MLNPRKFLRFLPENGAFWLHFLPYARFSICLVYFCSSSIFFRKQMVKIPWLFHDSLHFPWLSMTVGTMTSDVRRGADASPSTRSHTRQRGDFPSARTPLRRLECSLAKGRTTMGDDDWWMTSLLKADGHSTQLHVDSSRNWNHNN